MSEDQRANATVALNKAKQYAHVDIDRAIRFAEKSIRIHDTPQARSYLKTLQTLKNKPKPKPARPAAAASAAPRQRKAAPKDTKKNYTAQDQAQCRKILKTKDYYARLGLAKGCKPAAIKKAFYKLSRKVHPDKCSAPEAEEAFKHLNKAYEALSDDKQRRYYDQTGETQQQTQTRRQTGGRGASFHGDPTFDDIFRMFTQGGAGGFQRGGGMGGGGFYRTYGNTRAHQRQARGQQQQAGGSKGPMQQLMSFLPIILLVFFTLMGSSGESSTSPFRFSREGSFSIKRTTSLGDVPYYVDYYFDRRYARDARSLAQVEATVNAEFHQDLQRKCSADKTAQTEKIHKAKQYQGESRVSMLEKAYDMPLFSCDKLFQYEANL